MLESYKNNGKQNLKFRLPRIREDTRRNRKQNEIFAIRCGF